MNQSPSRCILSKLHPTAGILLFGATALQGQFNEADPFAGNYRIAASDEILFAVADSETGEIKLRLLDANPEDASSRDHVLIDSLALPGAKLPIGSVTERESPAIDLEMLDLDNDADDDMLVFFEGAAGEPILQRPTFNPATGKLSPGNRYMLTDYGFPLFYEEKSNRTFTEMRVIAAQLDKDGAAEFLLAYWGGDGEVVIIAAEFDDSDNLVILGSIADVQMQSDIEFDRSAASDSARFDITPANIDAIYGDEIVLAYVWQDFEAVSGVYRKVFLRVYRFNTGSTDPIQFLFEHEEPDWDATSRTFDQVFRLAVTAGDFDNNGLDELAMASSIGSRSGGSTNYFEIAFYQPNEAMTGLTSERQYPYITETTLGNDIYPLDLTAGDFNYDNIEDLGYLGRQGARVYSRFRDGVYVDDLVSIGFGQYSENSEHVNIASGVAVTDLDADTDRDLAGELVTISAVESGPDDNWRVRVGEYTETFPPSNDPPCLAMVTGDVDADSLRLGSPRLFRRSELGQPIMILNSPPTHFDVINGQPYDVNKSLTGEFDSYASYTLQNELIQEVSTEVRADWALSAGIYAEIEAGVETPVAKAKGRVKASLDGRYGQGFSRVRNAGQTIRETRQFVARGDDLIYASVADYDILEYPVYRNGDFLGTIASVIPKSPRLVTFNSKSPRAAEYVSPHEPGNILSYSPREAIADNPLISNAISPFSGFTWEMQGQGSSSWTLELSQYEQKQLTHTTDLSVSARIEVEASVEGEVPIARVITGSLGITVGGYVQGDYSRSTVKTSTTTVSVDHTVLVDFGKVDVGILGDTTYEVTPYLYWGTNGALVLDYAADPVLGDGYEGWWQQVYGHAPDLTFTLPWRHDIARGSNIPEELTERTRNIIVSPASPRAGDRVDIIARVNNYSLDPAGAPPSVLRFYLDNQDGSPLTRMIGEEGQTELNLPRLDPRASLAVALTGWKVPWTVNPDAKIYAVIDEDNQIAEIHEDNNTGWALLNAAGGSVWPDASFYDDHWLESPWLGWVNEATFPFVVHLHMQNLYIPENTTPDSFFYYDYALAQWCWSSPAFWPYIYFFANGQGHWLFYYEGSTAPNRWYYDPTSGSYIQEAQL